MYTFRKGGDRIEQKVVNGNIFAVLLKKTRHFDKTIENPKLTDQFLQSPRGISVATVAPQSSSIFEEVHVTYSLSGAASLVVHA